MIDEDLLRMSVLVTHLDEVDYYALFEIPRDATTDDVRDAFHQFALRFHPDRHVGNEPHRKHAHAIFKRGAEAYRVLMNATLRERYDAALAKGLVRLPAEAMRPETGRMAMGADAIPSGALPFYERAKEALAKRDFGGAKMHLALAASRGTCAAFVKLEEDIRNGEREAKKR